MSRTGRRHSIDYLEENEELQESLENYEYFDSETETEAVDIAEDTTIPQEDEPEEKSSAKSVAVAVLLSIGKVVLVILVLVGLFFASMKLTQKWISKNQETETYGSDAPVYEDDIGEETPYTADEPDDNSEDESESEPESEPETNPESGTASTPDKEPEKEPENKPENEPESGTPSTPDKEPEDEPSTTPPPSEPSKPNKPSITPGNPAA